MQITLHQLLNEMDGLTPDAEVLFLLTTNQPNAIETALAGRPGRVDQAIEFPMPDADCRRSLIELYGRGLDLTINDVDRVVALLDGASPAFIQELMRKAALIAAEQREGTDATLQISDGHLLTALRELVLGGGELTRKLFGFAGDMAIQES
jgi:ATP-dependent 26S proteasome regulatory subunit